MRENSVLYRAWLPLLISMAAAPHASATSSVSKEREPTICLTFALNWRGTLDDVRQIAVKPIPESYRRLYGWTGCQNLVKGSLIDWHLAFGDERSTTQALQFLATTALEGQLSVQDFETALPDAWRRAEQTIKRHPLKPGAAELEREEAMQALRNDKAIRYLQTLVAAHDRFALLAALYLRGAEFFRSQALLDKAAIYLEPLDKAGEFFYEGQRVAKAAEGSTLQIAASIETRGVNNLHDLQMRYALARARISQSPVDLSAAAAVIQENGDPIMREAAEPLIDRGEEFCESPSASEMLRASCDNENDLAGRLRSFWRSLAQVELANGTKAPRPGMQFPAFDVAWQAIDAAAGQTVPERVRYDSASDDHVILLLAKAEAQIGRSQAANTPPEEAASLRAESLNDLFRAERLTPPSLNPNRFRQIADLYLTIFKSGPQDRQAAMIEEARQAAYLQQILAGLAQIKVGGPELPQSSISPR